MCYDTWAAPMAHVGGLPSPAPPIVIVGLIRRQCGCQSAPPGVLRDRIR